MPAADIVILHHGDEPPWPHLPPPISHDLAPMLKVCILEEGMVSGLPSIAIAVDLPAGGTHIVETSMAIFSSIVVAARAAFPEAFAGGPLDPSLTREP